MYKVDIEFPKDDNEIEPILSWLFENTTGRFHPIEKNRYWFFEFEEDSKKFKNRWYEVPYENYKWKDTEYECVEDDITSNIHHIVLYFPENHDNGIKWKIHEWCEQNIGRYAGIWYSTTKQIHIDGRSSDTLVAYVFCFKVLEDAMAFRLMWT